MLSYSNQMVSGLVHCRDAAADSTSFPGFLILPPPGVGGGKMRDPGNEVAADWAGA